MPAGYCVVKNGSEVIYVNPARVCYFSAHGNGMTRIVFDGAPALDVKAAPAEVEKMLCYEDGLHLTPVSTI